MRRRSGWIAPALLVVGALTACTTPPGSAQAPTGVTTPTVTSPRVTTTGPATAADPSPSTTPRSTITLAFAGDVNFEGHGELVRDHGLDALLPLLGGADVAMVNLETAITGRGTPQPKLYHFRTTLQALVTLQQAGVDGVSLANNHAVDYGAAGLTDTLAARATSPIPVIGIGTDAADAFSPAVFTVGGVSVAVLASTQVDDYTVHTFPATETRPGVAGNLTETRLLAAVTAARARYDVVAVFLHWGTDYTLCPDAAQRHTARALEAAGVDVVVGGHAHRVQGTGWQGRTYVGYGLGNFVWLNTRSAVDTFSGVLTVTIDARRAVADRHDDLATRAAQPSLVTAGSWRSLVVGSDGIPRDPTPAQSPGVAQELATARACSGLAQTAP